jgi:hypothetical protein
LTSTGDMPHMAIIAGSEPPAIPNDLLGFF